MKREMLKRGACSFEVLTEGQSFVGLGKIAIGGTEVRSGRLPLRPYTQSFKGSKLRELRLLGVDQSSQEIRTRTEAIFSPVALATSTSFEQSHSGVRATALVQARS